MDHLRSFQVAALSPSPVGRVGARACEARPARARQSTAKPLKILQLCCGGHRADPHQQVQTPPLRKAWVSFEQAADATPRI